MGTDPARLASVTAESAATFLHESPTQADAAPALELEYLSYLSHDLNNSLSAVSLHMKLLKRRLDDLPQFVQESSMLDRTQRCIDHTTSAMRRLLTHARIRSGTEQLDLVPVRLHDLAASVAAAYAAAALAKGLELRVEVPRDAVVRSDADLLVVVLQNLVGNSVKYSERGLVRVRSQNIEGRLGARCVLSVSDEGPGISPIYMNDIFVAFRRGETHGREGRGLGLAIARRAANALGGRLSVESEVGVGSTFTLSVPCDPSQEPAEPAASGWEGRRATDLTSHEKQPKLTHLVSH
jgi:signal transduction histidine kinase